MRRFPLDPSGLWREVRAAPAAVPCPALFLDRDGTLIELVPYLSRAEQVAAVPGAFESLTQAVRAGFRRAWQLQDYATIITVAQKIPDAVLQEDPKLLMWYDQAVTRSPESRPTP